MKHMWRDRALLAFCKDTRAGLSFAGLRSLEKRHRIGESFLVEARFKDYVDQAHSHSLEFRSQWFDPDWSSSDPLRPATHAISSQRLAPPPPHRRRPRRSNADWRPVPGAQSVQRRSNGVVLSIDTAASAVMVRDRAAFDAALAHLEGVPKQTAGEQTLPSAEIVSEALFYAIEWPYALDRLLATRADPNHRKSFGKTALMVAAHFDRIDSIHRLLQAGAKVNAETIAVQASWMEGAEAHRPYNTDVRSRKRRTGRH